MNAPAPLERDEETRQAVRDLLRHGGYKPTGKLSFSWPRSMDQVPIHAGDAQYDPLFAYGFGLTY